MLKKIFIVLTLVIAAVMSTSIVFANNNLGQELQDSMNKAGQSIRNFGNDVLGTNNSTNHDQHNNNTHMGTTAGNNNHNGIGGYSATRTANTFAGMTSTTWTWVILAIAATVIVALVWYYATQNEQRRKIDEQ